MKKIFFILLLSLILGATACGTNPDTTAVVVSTSPTKQGAVTAVQSTSTNRDSLSLYAQNCAACHGPTGAGTTVAPPLNSVELRTRLDDDAIRATISNGRQASMPAWGPALQDQGVAEVAEYVMQLAGRDVDASLANAGQARFNTFCVACHGPEGAGQPMMGAPALNNEIWLYGNSHLRIGDAIRNGRNGQMPAFAERLGADKVHILAAYVKNLQQ